MINKNLLRNYFFQVGEVPLKGEGSLNYKELLKNYFKLYFSSYASWFNDLQKEKD